MLLLLIAVALDNKAGLLVRLVRSLALDLIDDSGLEDPSTGVFIFVVWDELENATVNECGNLVSRGFFKGHARRGDLAFGAQFNCQGSICLLPGGHPYNV